MNPLLPILKAQIDRFGPLSIRDYMNLCLLHPEHGYYTTGTPLGRTGDFITAPEISQMFGEMLGLALAQNWLDQGAPARFCLAELGPGQGTLMADILRVFSTIPDPKPTPEIWLVEASPKLREVQAALLKDRALHFADHVSDLPDLPLFLVANEFFDALPIRQYQRSSTGWQERLVGWQGSGLAFGLGPELTDSTFSAPDLGVGAVYETSSAACAIMGEIDQRIATFGGAALIIDYGDETSKGTTFQAVARHQKVSPLDDPGRADLTAHVDFGALARAAPLCKKSRLTPQGIFLERLGITARAQQLAQKLAGAALENHIAAHRRLTHPEEMGALFKVLALCPQDAPLPVGVDHDEP